MGTPTAAPTPASTAAFDAPTPAMRTRIRTSRGGIRLLIRECLHVEPHHLLVVLPRSRRSTSIQIINLRHAHAPASGIAAVPRAQWLKRCVWIRTCAPPDSTRAEASDCLVEPVVGEAGGARICVSKAAAAAAAYPAGGVVEAIIDSPCSLITIPRIRSIGHPLPLGRG